MPKSPEKQEANNKKPKSVIADAHIDIVMGGPLLIVPTIHQDTISGIEVFSPDNGHPVGAVFLPGVWFSDAELNDPKCVRWPEPESFSLLDPHSYCVELTQDSSLVTQPLSTTSIPASNHLVKPGRKLSHGWEVAIAILGKLSEWSSQRLFRVTEDLYMGGDAPRSATVSGMHRFTYRGITGAEFHGAGEKQREYFRANAANGGSLIVMGEIPYQPTLLHERRAIDSLAKLAGLDLHLVATDPQPHKSRLMHHTTDCGHSIVVA